MRPQELLDPTGLRYLQAVHYHAGGMAKVPVPLEQVRRDIGCTADDAMRLSTFWRRCGSLEQRADREVALTHIGVAQAEYLAGDDPKRHEPSGRVPGLHLARRPLSPPERVR